jgi:hypothetical protein
VYRHTSSGIAAVNAPKCRSELPPGTPSKQHFDLAAPVAGAIASAVRKQAAEVGSPQPAFTRSVSLIFRIILYWTILISNGTLR